MKEEQLSLTEREADSFYATIESGLLLTEREADLFYATIEPELDKFVAPDFNIFDLFVYMDYLYDEKEPQKVIGFIGDTENKEYQIDLHKTPSGYLATLWEENYLLLDIHFSEKGIITDTIKQ